VVVLGYVTCLSHVLREMPIVSKCHFEFECIKDQKCFGNFFVVISFTFLTR
jgi:hypothetical protein